MDRFIKTVQNGHGFFCRNANAGQRPGSWKAEDDFPPGKGHHLDKRFRIKGTVIGNNDLPGCKMKCQRQPFTLCRWNLPRQGKGHAPTGFHSQNPGSFFCFPGKGCAFLQHGLCLFRQLTGRHIRFPFLPQRLIAVPIPYQQSCFVKSAVHAQQIQRRSRQFGLFRTCIQRKRKPVPCSAFGFP